MTELVALDRIIFECTIEGGVPVKKLEHDIYRIADGKEVLSGREGEVITLSREQELMRILGSGGVYATEVDLKLHYDGR
ncbi:hypothetical protein HY500_02190 [Candidatus Woesearchaeota archaeon]|nr:hypothetical protein [Candidatus Woesearchaeota archaeon]